MTTPDAAIDANSAIDARATPTIRPATPADLPACTEIWRDSINDYLVRLNQTVLPAELERLGRLYEHTRATDPERFLVATHPDADDGPPGGERIVAFGSAVERGSLWFLSMLFVRPGEQAKGLGRQILEGLLPPDADERILGTATDSAQPISNALYSRYGLTPRMPLWDVVGEPGRARALPSLPADAEVVACDEIAAGPPDGAGHRELVETVGRLDRELAGFEHPQDHRYLRQERRLGFLYRLGGEAAGYGYASPAGRIGPVAVLDAALLPAVIGDLMRRVEPRGALAIWMPGEAGERGTAFQALLQVGFRLDGFPLLLLWNRPYADFSRYLPISPGLI